MRVLMLLKGFSRNFLTSFIVRRTLDFVTVTLRSLRSTLSSLEFNVLALGLSK